MPLAIVLFSGGLDSMLAARLLQRQGLEVRALNVRTWYHCSQQSAARAAGELGVPLDVVDVGDEYAEVIRRPRFGRGRGVNPCLDCRVAMCRLAAGRMGALGADLVATGEVLGQRPMSQKRRDLDVVEHHSGLAGRLLRPLSARLLRPTLAEEQGLVDRERLGAFSGPGRSGLVRLAAELGIRGLPASSSGCALVHPAFTPRVMELLRRRPDAGRFEFMLLRFGRFQWLDGHTKLILGRNAEENVRLAELARQATTQEWLLVEPENFAGPTALVVGPGWAAGQAAAAAEIVRRSRAVPAGARLRVSCSPSALPGGGVWPVAIGAGDKHGAC